MLLKCILAQICAFQLNKVKWCFEKVFYQFSIFGFKNAKSKFLKKIRVLRAFFRIEVQVISNSSYRLEKTQQTPEFLLMNDIL